MLVVAVCSNVLFLDERLLFSEKYFQFIGGSQGANWQTDEALALAVDLLKAHAPLKAAFCANDKMTLGARLHEKPKRS
jgi:ABC-type sugar transport system substrate-binding protein